MLARVVDQLLHARELRASVDRSELRILLEAVTDLGPDRERIAAVFAGTSIANTSPVRSVRGNEWTLCSTGINSPSPAFTPRVRKVTK